MTSGDGPAKPMARAVAPASLICLLALAGCSAPEPEAPLVYCYRTLADIVCQSEPDPGHDGRLVGTFRRAGEAR